MEKGTVVAGRFVRSLPWLFLTCAFATAGWSLCSGGIIHQLCYADSAESSVEVLKQYFAGFGILAPLAYVAFVIAEVVIAPLPGLMLYAPGGILFGPLLGGLLALIGNTIGAGIACSLVRSVGDQWLTRFFERNKLERVQQKVEHRGPLLIFLLRINPLTSSDVVSYAAGLTRIPTWRVMSATACGMIPMCFGQAWLASSLSTAFPELFYPFLIVCILYILVVIRVLRQLLDRTGKAQ